MLFLTIDYKGHKSIITDFFKTNWLIHIHPSTNKNCALDATVTVSPFNQSLQLLFILLFRLCSYYIQGQLLFQNSMHLANYYSLADIDQLTSYLSAYFSDLYDHSMCYETMYNTDTLLDWHRRLSSFWWTATTAVHTSSQSHCHMFWTAVEHGCL